MTIEHKFTKIKDDEDNSSENPDSNASDEDIDNKIEEFQFMNQSNENLVEIQNLYLNLFDYCLINALKLIRNTLDPQGNIKNFVKFNSNTSLKTSILKLM